MGRKTDALIKGIRSAKSSVESLTLLKLTIARIKVVRNKRSISAQKLRKEIANLIQSGQDAHVYITKVDILIKEENLVAAYDLIEQFCNSVIRGYPIIETQRNLPNDMKESIASLVYAAPRCTDLVELKDIKDIFTKKYGREFAAAVNELRPDCGVNRGIIEKLTTGRATGEAKLKLMEEICKEHKIQWTPGEALTGSSSSKSLDGSRQNEGPSKSTLGNVNATRAEGSAYPVQFDEIALRKDSGANYSRVSQAAEYSPSSLQVTNLNVDMTKQMEFMENDGSTKIETDEGKTETGLQHVVDDLKDVSIQSGSKFYASTEEEEREGEGEGKEGDMLKRKSLNASTEDSMDKSHKIKDILGTGGLNVENPHELDISQGGGSMKRIIFNSNSMDSEPSGTNETKFMDMIPEKKVSYSSAPDVQLTKKVESFQENEEVNNLSSRIEQIPCIEANPGVQKQSETVTIPGIPSDAMAIATEAARLALLDYAKMYGSPIPDSVNLNHIIGLMAGGNLKSEQDEQHADEADYQTSFEDHMEEKETFSSKTQVVNKSDGDDNDNKDMPDTIVTGVDINQVDYTWGDNDETNNLSSVFLESSSNKTPEDEYLNSIFLRHSETRPTFDNSHFLEVKPSFNDETVSGYRKHPRDVHDKRPDPYDLKYNQNLRSPDEILESRKDTVNSEGLPSHKSARAGEALTSHQGTTFVEGSISRKSTLFNESIKSHMSTVFDESSLRNSTTFDEVSTSYNSATFNEDSESFRDQVYHELSNLHKISDLNYDLDELPPKSAQMYESPLYDEEGQKSRENIIFDEAPMYDEIPDEKPKKHKPFDSDIESSYGGISEVDKLKSGDSTWKSMKPNNLQIEHHANTFSMHDGTSTEYHTETVGTDRDKPEDQKYKDMKKPSSRRTKKSSTPTMTQLQHIREEESEMVAYDVSSGSDMKLLVQADKAHVSPQSRFNQRPIHQEDTEYTLDHSRHSPLTLLNEIEQPLSSNRKQQSRKHQEHYKSPQSLSNRTPQLLTHEESFEYSTISELDQSRDRNELDILSYNRRQQQLKHQEQYKNPQARHNRRSQLPSYEEEIKYSSMPQMAGQEKLYETFSESNQTSTISDDVEPLSSNRRQHQLKHQEKYQSSQSRPNWKEKFPIHEGDTGYSVISESDQLRYRPSMTLDELEAPSFNRRQQQLKHHEKYQSSQSPHNQKEKIPLTAQSDQSRYRPSMMLDVQDPPLSSNRMKQPKHQDEYQSTQSLPNQIQKLPSHEKTEYPSVLEPVVRLESEQTIPSRHKSFIQDNVQPPLSNRRRQYQMSDPQVEQQEEILSKYIPSMQGDLNTPPSLSSDRMKQKQKEKEKGKNEEQYRSDGPIAPKPMKPSGQDDDDEARTPHRRRSQQLSYQEQVDHITNPGSRSEQDRQQRTSLASQEQKSSFPALTHSRKERMKQADVEIQDSSRIFKKPSQIEENITRKGQRAKQDIESESSASVRVEEKIDTRNQPLSASFKSSLPPPGLSMVDPIILATIPPPKKSVPFVTHLSTSPSATISAATISASSSTSTSAGINTGSSGFTSTSKPPNIDELAANFEALRNKKLSS